MPKEGFYAFAIVMMAKAIWRLWCSDESTHRAYGLVVLECPRKKCLGASKPRHKVLHNSPNPDKAGLNPADFQGSPIGEIIKMAYVVATNPVLLSEAGCFIYVKSVWCNLLGCNGLGRRTPL